MRLELLDIFTTMTTFSLLSSTESSQSNICDRQGIWWKAKPPIALDNECELECRSSCKGTFKWVGGPHKDLITFDNSVLEPTKYSLSIKENGVYSLIIKNITIEDLTIYSCHCGFSQCETNLTLSTTQTKLQNQLDEQNSITGISCIFKIVIIVTATVLCIVIIVIITIWIKRNKCNKDENTDKSQLPEETNLKEEE